MSDHELQPVDCYSCGIRFGLTEKVVKLWTKNSKDFFCPNGHPLAWTKDKDTPEQKELKALREEVKDLKAKLETALKDAEDQKKRADDLAIELEIYKPASVEKE
jgi:hypothetical protein